MATENDTTNVTTTADTELVVGAETIVEGWDDAKKKLETVQTGSFLKLQGGEAVRFTFAGPPTVYIAHRDVMTNENGEPMMDGNGNERMGIFPCDRIYSDSKGRCLRCDAKLPAIARTVAPVYVVGPNGAPIYASLIEGGPKLWKIRILPVVEGNGPAAIYELKRFGEGLRTDYSFTVIGGTKRVAGFDKMAAKFVVPKATDFLLERGGLSGND